MPAPVTLSAEAPPLPPAPVLVLKTDVAGPVDQPTEAAPAVLPTDVSLLIGSGVVGTGVPSGAVRWTQLMDRAAPAPSRDAVAPLVGDMPKAAAVSGTALGTGSDEPEQSDAPADVGALDWFFSLFNLWEDSAVGPRTDVSRMST
jgi:hypothetical protein